MKTILVFMCLAAVVVANTFVTISGNGNSFPFRAPAGLNYNTVQQVKISNGYVGENFTNSISSVSFVVHDNSASVTVSYPGGGAAAAVGSILAGADGWGQFYVKAANPGRYGIAITAKYRIDGESQWSFATRFFFLWVGDNDDDDDKKRDVEVAEVDVADVADTHDFSARAGDDLEISPDNYFSRSGVSWWNSFQIIAGDNNLNNISWVVVPNDPSVIIAYGSGVQYNAFQQKNTTYNTSISITGNPGNYDLNCTVKYRKAQNPNFRTYWIVYPLYIEGAGTASLRLGAEKAMGSNVEGVQTTGNYVRVEVAFAVGIAAVALVAIAAVIGAMVVLNNKKNQFISV